jgi:hypothetical protein
VTTPQSSYNWLNTTEGKQVLAITWANHALLLELCHTTKHSRHMDQKGQAPEPNVAQIKDVEAHVCITNIFLE